MGANKHRPRSGKLKQDFEDPPSPRGPHGEGGAGVPGGGVGPLQEGASGLSGAEFPLRLQERPSRHAGHHADGRPHAAGLLQTRGTVRLRQRRPPGLALGSAEGPRLGIQRAQTASNPPARREPRAAHPSAPPTAGTRL